MVQVDGHVKVPGEYPLEPGMTVRDLIRAGGGTADEAYGGNAELVRYRVVNGEARRTELMNVDLAAALRGDPAPISAAALRYAEHQGGPGVGSAGKRHARAAKCAFPGATPSAAARRSSRFSRAPVG